MEVFIILQETFDFCMRPLRWQQWGGGAGADVEKGDSVGRRC